MTDYVITYLENAGVYEVYQCKGNVITYYSYFGSEGFYKIKRNCKTGKETKTRLRYKKTPRFLIGKNGLRYNYFTG